jgi:hypothetical protein
MRERAERILRIVCYALAALLLYQVARDVIRSNPLAGARIPELPTLAGDTNAPAAPATNAAPRDVAKKGTNAANAEIAKAGTNAPPIAPAKAETNAAAPVVAVAPIVVPDASGETPKPPKPPVSSEKGGTNLVAEKSSTKADTNAVARPPSRPRPDMAAMGGPSGPGKKPAELSPAVKARVDRIYDSELFGQVMRPLPMALLGIAGNTAFLRSASGQTGLVKEGEKVGELKLLKIGINRVLVEQEGEKKELMIFSGYGGESLLPKEGAK